MTMTMDSATAEQLDRVLNKLPPSATWYRPDGKAIPGLPTDAYHRLLYQKKGWSLTPPRGGLPSSGPPTPPPNGAKATLSATVPPPPKHVHVMWPEIGSPCLVAGCMKVRTTQRAVKGD